MEQIRAKAASLRLLLNRVDSRKELIGQVNGFFDDAVAQLESRRAELLADIRSHSVPADQQARLLGVVSDIERLAKDAPALGVSAMGPGRLRDAEERLDACLGREPELLQSGQFDAQLASRRTEQLLKCLTIGWQDEWSLRRQADNPFATSAADVEPDDDCFAGPDGDVGSTCDRRDSLDGIKGSAYQLPDCALDFAAVLQLDGSDKKSDAPHKRTRTRRKKLSPEPLVQQQLRQQQQQHRVKVDAANAESLWSDWGISSAAELKPITFSQALANRPDIAAKGAFDTRSRPTSLAFLHGSFYVLETAAGDGGVVRIYDRRGRYKHPLPIRSGGSVHRIRVCHQRGWLILVDRCASRVHCVKSNGLVEASYGPSITKRFALHQPEDAICTGDLLFIACPRVGIFIISLSPPVANEDVNSTAGGVTTNVANSEADEGGENFRVTQSNASLGLNCPVRLAWNYSEHWLLVIDREPGSEGRYTVHRFRFERIAGVGGGGRLIRWCGRPPLLDSQPDSAPPTALSFRGNVLMSLTAADGCGRIMRIPTGRVFDQFSADSGGDVDGGLRWSIVVAASGWSVSDACYMNTQEFAICDSAGVCVLSLT